MPRLYVVVIEAALVMTAGALAWLAAPEGRAIRVRNAFLLRRGSEEDFAWTPAAPPTHYRAETAAPPAEIERALTDAGVMAMSDDWAKARAIVTMLVSHSRHPVAIRADLSTTFRGIVAGSGYCADYVRVYLAAAAGAGLFCRQWAFSFDGFGGHGHTFVEVFDRQRGAWAFLDVHNNVYAVASGSQTPLSALELRRMIIASPSDVRFPRAGPGRVGFRHLDKLVEYYSRGVSEWYMWWGNDVISRESTALHSLGRFVGPLTHRLGSAMGRLPAIVVLATPENNPRIVRMERLRRWIIAAAVSTGALGLLLAVPFLYAVLIRVANA